MSDFASDRRISRFFEDHVYKTRRAIMDRGRWRGDARKHQNCGAMQSSGAYGNAGDRLRTGGRTASADSLVREVRWQLFRRDELPARLRRLQRLEEAAESESRMNGAGPGTEPPAR
jgi:hypothetical protein